MFSQLFSVSICSCVFRIIQISSKGEVVVSISSMFTNEEYPCVTRSTSFQRRFRVNVLARLLSNTLIGPFLIEDRTRGVNYLTFVEDMVPPVLDDLRLRRHLWYQLDSAPAHFTLPVCQWLDHHFPGRWIGRGGPAAWRAQSPGLMPLDFFLWSFMKEKVYQTEIASREEFVAKSNAVDMEIRQHSARSDGVLQRVFAQAGYILSICCRQLTITLPSLKQLTTELSDKMAMESSGDRHMLCSCNSETGMNIEKVY